jgi:type II secretory pathway pseudopilin PulG
MKHRTDAGFSLAALIFFATAASILLAAAVPAYVQQARREREEELIFRGEEYMRAIQKYQRKFTVYPPSIDALLETNQLRFLRRAYKDPITDKEFRLISLGPGGTLVGSVMLNQRINNTPLVGGNPPGLGTQGMATSPPPSNADSVRTSPPQQTNNNQAGGPGAFGPGASFGSPSGTAGIVGVASSSEETSIKVYNMRQKYNEWEFLAILGQPGATGTPPPPPPGTGGPGTSGTPGTQTSPITNNGNTLPGIFGNPAGTGQSGRGGGQTNPQPFGFGSPVQGQGNPPVKR